jgi:acyl carrier protein
MMMMETTEIYARLTAILREVFLDDDLTAVPEMTAKDVDGWDSLSNLRFIMSAEREFQIKFSASEIGKLNNVGELVVMIAAKLKR